MTGSDSATIDTAEPSSPFPAEGFVSYAQNGEDILLWRTLSHVGRGCYIDIGASEPEADSVTHALYKRGWRGINIEPAPATFARLCAARPDEINLNLAVGSQNGTTTFFLVDGGNGLSTAIAGQAETLGRQGWAATQTTVPVRTLASIAAEHVRGPVHFLKIDVEGGERAVLEGADFTTFRPWIILLEATAPNSRNPTHGEWEDLLIAAGYRFAWFDGLNRFYVAAEHEELTQTLQVQPNIFDGYTRFREFQSETQLHEARAERAAIAARLEESTTALNASRQELAVTRDDAHRLQAERDGLTQERDRLTRELQLVSARLAEAAQESRQRGNEIGKLRGDLAERERHLQAMHASTSWRLTRPLRAAARLLGRG